MTRKLRKFLFDSIYGTHKQHNFSLNINPGDWLKVREEHGTVKENVEIIGIDYSLETSSD